jgi:hypothetical protein
VLESGPPIIFGLVMSVIGIRDVNKVAQAAKLRRGVKFEEIRAFSKEVARMMDSIASWNKKPLCLRCAVMLRMWKTQSQYRVWCPKTMQKSPSCCRVRET